MTTMTTVRTAGIDDASMLASLGARTFRAAYAELMASDPTDADDPLERYIAGTFTVAGLRAELADPRNVFLVIEQPPGTTAGYAVLRFGSNHPAVRGPGQVELARVYLEPALIGRGLGAALMEAALARALAGGGETVWLTVWSENRRAISFYERTGFTTVGAHPFEIGGLTHQDLTMARPVAPGNDGEEPPPG
jgi:ribosomal protein S18 acetylase RimI-like enzyme